MQLDRLIAVYDDECRFCRWGMALVLSVDRRRMIRPVGFAAAAAVGAPSSRDSWHLRDSSGRWHSGGAAGAQLLLALPMTGPPGRALGRHPATAERLYRAVASRRGRFGKHLPGRWVAWADRVIARRVADP